MAIAVATASMIQWSTTWTGTAPGLPGTQTVSGTLASAQDVSAYCSAVDVPMNSAVIEGTTFGSGGFKVNYPGLKDGMLTLTLLNDFAVSNLDTIIWTIGLGTTLYYDVKATNSARGTSNPSYVGAVILSEYKPIAVSVGGVPTVQVSWPTTGQFTRLTS